MINLTISEMVIKDRNKKIGTIRRDSEKQVKSTYTLYAYKPFRVKHLPYHESTPCETWCYRFRTFTDAKGAAFTLVERY